MRRHKIAFTKPVYAVAAVLFAVGLALVPFDKAFSNWLHATMRPWDFWLQRVTWFGDGRMLLPLAAAAALGLWLAKKKPQWHGPALSIAAFLVSGAIVQTLKSIFARPRPFLEWDARYAGSSLDFTRFHWFSLDSDFGSFPSGHTTCVFSVTWAIAATTKCRVTRAVLVVVAATIALSRVALAKHFLGDVFAGSAVGITGAQLVVDIYLAQRAARDHSRAK